MSKLWKVSLQQATQSGMTTVLGLLKSGKLACKTHEQSGRPDQISWRMAWPQQFVIENDDAHLEMFVESRSFVNRVNDQVQQRQKDFKCHRKWRKTFFDLVECS